jgi:hypothetical protein
MCKAGTRRYNLQNTPVYIPIIRYIYTGILCRLYRRVPALYVCLGEEVRARVPEGD